MTCPRCQGEIFRRRDLDGGGLAHVCEDCGWPGGFRLSRRITMSVLIMARLPRGGVVMTASHAEAAHLRRYAALLARPDIEIHVMERREPHKGFSASTFHIDEAQAILGDHPENLI